jgi:hypothetical protein
LYVVVTWTRCVGRVIGWLSQGLLGVLLAVSLVPVAWLEVVPLLVERVLRSVVGNASSGSDCFDHLVCLGVLYGLGFILVVILWKGEGDDRVQNAWSEAVQEEAYGFFTSDGVAGTADEFFEVGYVLVDFWEAHLAAIQIKSGSLLVLGVCEMLCEFLYERIPGKLYVVIYWV